MKVLRTLKVRYRNNGGTLSRPHKIRQVQDNKNNIFYCTMNMSHKIDESTFVTKWDKPIHQQNTKVSIKDTTEIIRVKFINKKGGYYRPTKICKVTKGDTDEVFYCHLPIGNRKKIDPSTFITTWVGGPTPTKKPLRNLSTEEKQKRYDYLIKNGYLENISSVIERGYSAKDVKRLRGKLGNSITANEAREELSKHGSMYKTCVALSDKIKEVKERREKAQEHVIHYGKITVRKKRLVKINSRRYNKLLRQKKIDKFGYKLVIK